MQVSELTELAKEAAVMAKTARAKADAAKIPPVYVTLPAGTELPPPAEVPPPAA